MNTYLECIPCFIRQTLDAARMATDDPALHEEMLRGVLRAAAEMDLAETPPVVGQKIHRRLRELTGNADPYAAVKTRFNEMALAMLPELRARIAAAEDPFAAAVRLAITGNIIDFGPKGNVTEADAREAIARALTEPLHGDMDAFRAAVEAAGDILYLADNAGEIVFDRALIERLPAGRVTVAVRGGPVINDATVEDAEGHGPERAGGNNLERFGCSRNGACRMQPRLPRAFPRRGPYYLEGAGQLRDPQRRARQRVFPV